MCHRLVSLLIALESLALSVGALTAQQPVSPDTMRAAGSTPRSPRGPEIGLTLSAAVATNTSAGAAVNRQFFQLAASAGWTLVASRDVALVYAPAVIPIAITTHDANYQYIPPPPCTGTCTVDLGGGTSVVTYHTVYGAGVTPFVAELHAFKRSPVSLIAGADGGILWFTRAVPQNDAAKFNFTAAGRAALQFRMGQHSALRVGYEYHHTSNAHSGAANPGLNSSMITVGAFREP